MAAISSNGTGGGNWSAAASWSGGVVPGAGDTVTIVSGDEITIDQNITTGSGSGTGIDVSGKFTINNPGASYTITLDGDLIVNSGGEIAWDMTTDTGFLFKLLMACGSDGEWGVIFNDGSVINMNGATKTVKVAIDGNHTATDTTILVA